MADLAKQVYECKLITYDIRGMTFIRPAVWELVESGHVKGFTCKVLRDKAGAPLTDTVMVTVEADPQAVVAGIMEVEARTQGRVKPTDIVAQNVPIIGIDKP